MQPGCFWVVDGIQAVYIRTARSMCLKGCPKYYNILLHLVRCCIKVSQVELIFTAHKRILLNHLHINISRIELINLYYKQKKIIYAETPCIVKVGSIVQEKTHSSGPKWQFVVNSDGIQLQVGLAQLSQTHECTLGSRLFRSSKYPDT